MGQNGIKWDRHYMDVRNGHENGALLPRADPLGICLRPLSFHRDRIVVLFSPP